VSLQNGTHKEPDVLDGCAEAGDPARAERRGLSQGFCAGALCAQHDGTVLADGVAGQAGHRRKVRQLVGRPTRGPHHEPALPHGGEFVAQQRGLVRIVEERPVEVAEDDSVDRLAHAHASGLSRRVRRVRIPIMTATPPEFQHVYVPDTGAGITLLLLHGTGGNEQDLIPLGHELLPAAALLSPRGQVVEGGMPRFFRRFAEGVFDVADLQARAEDLADWVDARLRAVQGRSRVVAVGYSNGANIAAAMLLGRPSLLAGAVLFRAMVPYVPDQSEKRDALLGVRVQLCEGAADPLVSRSHAERLATILRNEGADVSLAWIEGGHGLTGQDVHVAREFLRSLARDAAPRTKEDST
jgi:phospholipase/carboxylesterase